MVKSGPRVTAIAVVSIDVVMTVVVAMEVVVELVREVSELDTEGKEAVTEEVPEL